MALEPDSGKPVDGLDEGAQEAFEERAGILEFDAGYPREEAENIAWLATLRGTEKHLD